MNDHYISPPRTALIVPLPQLPKAFWAFHNQYYTAYRRYAHVHLDDPHTAGELVHRVMMNLAMNWARVMEEENPAAFAWTLLKGTVAQELELQGRQPALSETAIYQKVVRSVLESKRQEFQIIESTLGLYPAIARLPERQFDVMVLRYVLGFSTETTAHTMGITEATVRSHCHLARRKIAKDLGIDLDTDGDKEE